MRNIAVTSTILIIIVILPHVQPEAKSTDSSVSEKPAFKRPPRFILGFGRKGTTAKPKLGFFGTVFHLILEQVNDTKSAYNQISDLVSNQFSDDNGPVTESTTPNNGSTETPRISRAEFLKILDRNLKGLARLRNLEWREAKKDSWANLQSYKDEILGRKKNT